jgi:hypothetical protein
MIKVPPPPLFQFPTQPPCTGSHRSCLPYNLSLHWTLNAGRICFAHPNSSTTVRIQCRHSLDQSRLRFLDYIDDRPKGSGPRRNMFGVQGKPRCLRCDQQHVKVFSVVICPKIVVRLRRVERPLRAMRVTPRPLYSEFLQARNSLRKTFEK